MLQLILIFLLAPAIYTNPGYWKYYRPRSGYGGQHKAVNSYNKPVTAVAPYCRCVKDSTQLNVVVLDQAGTPLSNGIVWVGFQGKVKETRTNKKGFAKVEVRGCEIGIIVWRNGKQEEFRIVNLEKTKTNHKNVVIQIGKACNFLLYTNPTLEGIETISYLADINGGEKSTSGTVVGTSTSPICFDVEDGGSLTVLMTLQTADTFSLLCLDQVEEGGQASIGPPLPLAYIYTFLSPFIPTFIFAGGMNVYEKDNVLRSIVMAKLRIYYPVGSSIKLHLRIRSSFNFLVFPEFPGDGEANYLVLITLQSGTDLKGNAYFFDRYGVTKTVKLPEQDYSFSRVWVPGCVINGDMKMFNEINKVVDESSIGGSVEDFQKFCQEGIVPTLVETDEHGVEDELKSDTSHDFESTSDELEFDDEVMDPVFGRYSKGKGPGPDWVNV